MGKMQNTAVGLMFALTAVGCSHQAIEAENDAAHPKHAKVKSLKFSGTGRWFQFGQAPNPDLPWPPFELKTYAAELNFDTASSVVKLTRSQIIEAGRNRPEPVAQRVEQYLNAKTAWNIAATGNAPAATTPQPTAIEERAAEIWSTPQGFLQAVLANPSSTEDAADGSKLVSFTLEGKYKYQGKLNAKHELENVKTWIDNPVLGDTLIETQYSEYKDFAGIQFPAHIVRIQGGFPVLDLKVDSVAVNTDVGVPPPPAEAKVPAIQVKAEQLADGVYYLTGGTHHSVAIAQKDHIVLVEAPQNEARSEAVINKLKEIIPNKPIKYLINTHAHFDHSGGLRTFVDAGATIITESANQAYYQKIWQAPHTLNPDKLSQSHKAANIDSFTHKYVLSDGKRKIELHSIAGNSHNDAFILVYLPKEKILIEADAYTPLAANAPLPSKANPYAVNLDENIQKLKLKVDKIAALHGPNVVTLADLKTYIGKAATAK